MKKLMIFAVATMLVSLLAACGSNGNNASGSSSTPAATTETASAAPSTETASSSSEPFKLSVYLWNESQSKSYLDAVETKFKEKYPAATIEYKVVAGDKLSETLNADLAAGNAADIFYNQSPTVIAKAGYALDLSDQPYVSQMLPAIKDANTYQDKVYGLGLNTATFGALYNKKIFSDLGLTPPKTWDEFIAVCAKIKDSGIAPIVGGFKDTWTAWAVSLPIIENATYGTHPNFERDLYDGKAKINSPEMQNAYKKIEQLAQNDYFNKNILGINYDQEQQMFADGKGAMVLFGPWFISDVSNKTPKVDVGYFPLFDENGQSTLASGVDISVSINANTKHPQEAKDFVALMADKDLLPIHLKDKNTFSGVKDVSAEYDFPGMKDIQDALNTLPTAPQFQLKLPPSVLNQLIDTAIKTVSDKKFDPKDLDEADRLYQKDRSLVNY